MPYISRLDHAVEDSSDANVCTSAASMHAAVALTDDDDLYRLATSMQTHPVTLEQQPEQSTNRYKNPQSEGGSLAFAVKVPASESTGHQPNLESAVAGVGDALRRLEQRQTAIREKLTSPQSARELLLAPIELSSDDSVASDEAARRDLHVAVCLTPSSSQPEGAVEPESSVRPDEQLAVLQALVDGPFDGDVPEELLPQAGYLVEILTQDIEQDIAGTDHEFDCLGGAVKPPAERPHRPHVNTAIIVHDKPYPIGADTSAAPLSRAIAPTNPLSDHFFDDVPSEVFVRATWLRPSSSDVEGNRSESCWTWEGIVIWIRGIERG
jgi:hypothetical protein